MSTEIFTPETWKELRKLAEEDNESKFKPIPKEEKKGNQIKNIVLDISSFTSPNRLNDLLQVLKIIKQDIIGTKPRIVMPSYLFYELSLFIKAKEMPQKLVEVFNAWHPSYSSVRVAELVRGLSNNLEYLEMLKEFFLEYNPIPASEYVGNFDQIGEQTLYRKSLREQFGDVVGDIVFELLAVSHKLKAIIIAFGERFASLAYQAGIVLVKAKSRYKQVLKQKANVKRALRVMGYALSFQATSEMIDLLELPIYFEIHTTDIGLGLILLADG